MSKEVKTEFSSSEVDAGTYEETNSSAWGRFKSKAALEVNYSQIVPNSKWTNKGSSRLLHITIMIDKFRLGSCCA